MPALQYPQGYPATASNFFKQISIRYWSTKSWILLGGSFSPSFWRLAKKKSSMMSSSNFIDPLAIFYHSPNLLVQNPKFNPNVKSPFRQCWLDYHNGNDLISPWYIEKSPCTTYCIFISEKNENLGMCCQNRPTRLLQRPRIKIGKPPKVEQSLSNRKGFVDIERWDYSLSNQHSHLKYAPEV